MHDPIAFFITWVTYGTWLPGDARGWIEYHRGWQLPDSVLEMEAAAVMTEDACRLTREQRIAVEDQISETCLHRGWLLHAVHCRSNHVHVVVTAGETKPKKIRSDIKAWATRCLRINFDEQRENWWAERGSIRWLYDEMSLETAILYVLEAQERKRIS
ncbi:MAG: transposase [Planctomycetaceae bacterium]